MSKDEIDFDTLPPGGELEASKGQKAKDVSRKAADPKVQAVRSTREQKTRGEEILAQQEQLLAETKEDLAKAQKLAADLDLTLAGFMDIAKKLERHVSHNEALDDDEDEVPSSEDDLLAQKAFANIIRSCVDDIEIKISFKK